MAVRHLWFVAIVLVPTLMKINCKCATTFATTCEQVTDIARYAKPTWEALIIKNNECNSGRVKKNTAVLPAGAFNTTLHLEQLYIVEQLNSVESGAFAGLNNLQHLQLWGNVLKVLQRGMFANFHNLRKLDLRHNSIENLAHGFCEASSIKEIDLSFNSLTNIQVDMLDLSSLDTIKITHNRISFIAPKAFHSTLITLDLRYNEIEQFQDDTIQNLMNLKQLLISHNSVKSLPLLSALESLEILDLSHNAIDTLPSGAFSNLLELKRLLLDNNHLKVLQSGVFTRKLNVEALHLHRNNLTSLSGLVGEALPKLKEITIGANPWYCQCLLTIIQHVENRRIRLTECEDQYLSDGSSPICVSTPADCEKDLRLSEDVYEEFARAVEGYKCDTTVLLGI